MSGRQGPPQFNSDPDTGRKGYREPWEPVDERPVIAYDSCRCRACRQRVGIWKNDMERQVYEAAVAGNPKREDEGPMAYAKRISELVTGEAGSLLDSMPKPKQSRRERDAALMRLRGQAKEAGE